MSDLSRLKIRAYAIFDGGGVLGAALAGCLKAAEDHGLEFVGYGGTSAGSIIATLGAVGMSGDQIQKHVVGTPFVDFLNDSGRPVARFKKDVDSLLLHAGKLKILNCLYRGPQAFRFYRSIARLVSPLLGVDDGKTLKAKLHDLIATHRPDWDHHRVPNITFDLLSRTSGCRPLKIVASDVTRRRPVEFSAAKTEYSNSVLEAVRASTCYPFVFQPVELQRRKLVDGGLSSNLPASLFHKEQRQTGYPVFAFDLVDEDEEPKPLYDMSSYLRDMTATAIDAGDEFLRDVLDGVHHVPIPIPRRFDVLDFEISRELRQELFNIGHVETTKYLNNQAVLSFFAAQTGQQIQRELQVLYGEPALYQPVLAALARDVESVSQARNVRVTIMLPTGRKTRIVVYSHGMVRRRPDGSPWHDPDFDLEIPSGAGVSGKSWTTGKPAVADLTIARQHPEEWQMSPTDASKVPPDRESMLSFPIRRLGAIDHTAQGDAEVGLLGTLTLDSSTPLAETAWVENGSNSDVQRDVAVTVNLWVVVIQRLLLFDE